MMRRFGGSGGGARSAPWLQIQADVYGLPLRTAVVEEQASLGAAITAGVGAGIFGGVDEACARIVKYKDEVHSPDGSRHEEYMEYYQLFKDAFKANETLLHRATELGRK